MNTFNIQLKHQNHAGFWGLIMENIPTLGVIVCIGNGYKFRHYSHFIVINRYKYPKMIVVEVVYAKVCEQRIMLSKLSCGNWLEYSCCLNLCFTLG